MDCRQVNDMLDLLMDGALGDEEREAMEAHGQECPQCAAAIRATRQLKALFEQMEPEADVPLEAQAKWRGAVREASKRRKQKRLMRWIASAAAVIVVLAGVGLTFSLRGAPKQNTALSIEPQSVAELPEAEAFTQEKTAQAFNGSASSERSAVAFADEAPGAVVEADGVAYEMESEAAAEVSEDVAGEAYAADSAAGALGPACELAIQVDDVKVACDRICDLAQEYEADADVQTVTGGGANIYVALSADNAPDFLNAVVAMDVSGKDVETPALTGSGQLLVLLVVNG